MFEDLVPAGGGVWDSCVTSKRWRMTEGNGKLEQALRFYRSASYCAQSLLVECGCNLPG